MHTRLPTQRTSPHTSCALLSTRQEASSFNQPVTFDTSKVKATAGMFLVRSTRDQAPSLYSRGPSPRVHAACAAVPSHALPALRPHLSPPLSYALLSTRQQASSFNQPLFFDTSKVTDMYVMFQVRSARALAPSLSRTLLVHAARFPRRRFTPSSVPPWPASFVCPPFDSAGRKRLVRHQQVVHPLRMGGHPGLRPFWLWLELGSGKLPLKIGGCMCARDWSRVYGCCSDNSPLLGRGSHEHAHADTVEGGGWV